MHKDTDIVNKIKSVALEIGQLTYCSDCPNDTCIKELTKTLDFLLNEYSNMNKEILA